MSHRITTIELPKLKDYQRAVINTYQQNPKNHTVVVISPRQCGKSVALQNLLIFASLSEPNAVSIAVAPISAQSRKNFLDMCRIANPVLTNVNSSLLEVTFINGSTVLFKSAESGDNLRGLTVKKSGILCIDEFAYIKKDFYYNVLLPMVNVYHGSIFGFSTPRTKEGIFWELYNRGLSDNDPNYITIDWTKYDLSEYLPESLLEEYAKIMPRAAFLTEYRAQFNDSDGNVFSHFRECVSGRLNVTVDQPLYIGVDLGAGVGGDYTVITLAQHDQNNIYILNQVAFNDKTVSDTMQVIRDLVVKYQQLGCEDIVVSVERNSLGVTYIQLLTDLLDKTCATVCGFNTTNKSKNRIINQVRLLFEKGKIQIPDDEQLLSELAIYECRMSSSGLPTYNAPAGFHDDRVMSLCICCDLLYNEIM